MANSNKVPKREPCRKCNNPVFFAERVVVNEILYHRNCFVCARCGSGLKFGYFYETENDQEFCCEVCPDEEKFALPKNDSSRLSKSIAQKIAIFEKDKVLKKSLSDEEKSKSLNRQSPCFRSLTDSEENIHSNSNDKINVEQKSEDINDATASAINSNFDETVNEKESEIAIETQLDIDTEFEKLFQETEKVSNFENFYEISETIEKLSINENLTQVKDSNKNDDEIAADLSGGFKEAKDEVKTFLEENHQTLGAVSLQSEVENVDLNQSAVIDFSQSPILDTNSIKETTDKKHDNEIEYPDNLNPFGDENENSGDNFNRPSLNPFGSCSEDEDSSIVPNEDSKETPCHSVSKKLNTSTNPFESEDEDDPKILKTPIPTPRKLNFVTPEPFPRSLTVDSSGPSFKGSNSSLSSSNDGMSLRRKKKSPAPQPPKTCSLKPKKRPAPTPPSKIEPSSENVNETDILGNLKEEPVESSTSRRVIPLEECLIDVKSSQEQEQITYRRKIVPLSAATSLENLEKSKDDKEAQNRHTQCQISTKTDFEDPEEAPYTNKSLKGKWKRRKGPAPKVPQAASDFASPNVLQRRVLQMLPLQDIRHELEIIEVQLVGLEKQGITLEKIIREKCEGTCDNRTAEELLEDLPPSKNPKEVEELILQLFELVNEKNELFRKQAELMYLRRAHRLEEEQADVEYEIRQLMAQPEQNKTDSDKAKEESLIARLVEIVQLRNEVVDCLDRDRIREKEEDLSIKQRMEIHSAKLEQDYISQQTPTKLSKKEKKKLKESKKMKKVKQLDADKDLDTSEDKTEAKEKKQKKKKFLF